MRLFLWTRRWILLLQKTDVVLVLDAPAKEIKIQQEVLLFMKIVTLGIKPPKNVQAHVERFAALKFQIVNLPEKQSTTVKLPAGRNVGLERVFGAIPARIVND